MGGGRRGVVLDAGVAVTVAATQLVAGLGGPSAPSWGAALLVVGGLALVASRRAPVAVLAVTAVCALVPLALGYAVPAVAFLVAVYAAVRCGHRVAAVAGSGLVLVAVPVVLLVAGRAAAPGDAVAVSRDVLPLAWLVAAGAAGEALRQAERRADEAERTREEAARRRADAERLHLARELHDTLTHQISVIAVQAGAAVHLAGKRGEPVDPSLRAIHDAAREAARELRATLEALRDDGRTPPHGLDHVDGLVARARTAGLDATLAVEGRRSAVPAALDRTAYRVVQEALTNTARHAAATTASVRIDHRGDALVVQVDDDGRATPEAPPAPGIGLTGMRERVEALGGRLDAAPRREGGFTVRAELPVDRA